MRQRRYREFARWQRAEQHVQDLANERTQRLGREDPPHGDQVRSLRNRAGIGLRGVGLLVFELFG